jgi:hypothetical protein
MHATIRRWLTQVASASLVGQGESEELLTQNMLAFALSPDEARGLTADDLDRFLAAAFRQYAAKLASAPGPLWFYAWHDEMSGTLRICAAQVNRPEQLPFECGLNICDTSTPVTEGFLRSDYLDGIPRSELTESSWEEEEEEEDFVLDVFARLLPSVVTQ